MQLIKNILVPVDTDAVHLNFAKQVAELAKEHHSHVHLLYTADIHAFRSRNFPWLISPKTFYETINKKTALLNTWKRWLEKDYDIRVTTSVSIGSRIKRIIKYANEVNADLITFQQEISGKKWFTFSRTPAELIIAKSPCQVITILSHKNSMAEWKQVVIPITDFIPETRIQTIIYAARLLNLKIHLITGSQEKSEKKHSSDFYFMTETLKRLKPAGNVQVECRSLEPGNRSIAGYLKYAQSIDADILMTNRNFVAERKQRNKELSLHRADPFIKVIDRELK